MCPSGPKTSHSRSALRVATSSRVRFPVAWKCATAASNRCPEQYSSWPPPMSDQRSFPPGGMFSGEQIVREV